MYVLHGTKEAPVLLRTPSTHEVQLRRIHLPKLFGKSGWAPKEGFRRRTKGSKQSRSVASWRRRSTVERPSAIFQTVSPRTPVNKGIKKGQDVRSQPFYGFGACPLGLALGAEAPRPS